MALLGADDFECQTLVTDINLGPSPTGWEIAARAREIEERLPVVYMTSGIGDEWTSKGVLNSILIRKAFALAKMVTAVAHLLNYREPRATESS